jgi:sterol 3beta-glucosyltransferase
MIARAGQRSQADLGTMQEVDSGDSDDEGRRDVPYNSLDGAARLSRFHTANAFHSLPGQHAGSKASEGKHRRRLSDNKLLQSLPKLKMSGKKEGKKPATTTDRMSSSQILAPKASEAKSTEPKLSVSKQKSEAVSLPEDPDEKQISASRNLLQGSSAGASKSKVPVTTLAKRLQQIFQFENLEDVISGNYPPIQ